MKQKIRYLLFIGLPFLITGGFWFMIGVMNQKAFEISGWSFRDTFNLIAGGLPAAVAGAFLERVTRKRKESKS